MPALLHSRSVRRSWNSLPVIASAIMIIVIVFIEEYSKRSPDARNVPACFIASANEAFSGRNEAPAKVV
ncbi:hypothetical protein OM960_22375 [Defluviimonas sp. CAU 1641]|uniref:Uncharacterized protein n=1 Tax=Defluviimonas salinarum TaxID=2992147 RepID=A0ABT3J9B0_9RHOB|nr:MULTISPECIES: hypothetical protein [Defluviimonas]MCW3784277.1 hypothetical protein [Defluviimonas salinarum]